MARNDYSFYCELSHNNQWIPGRHHELICDRLQKVETGEITRLMIFAPPRNSKSMTVSETFPSYFIGKDPNRRVIETSYGDDLAQAFGYRNKQKIQEYGMELFGIMIDPLTSSKTDWGIAGYRGGMISAGIMSGITGKGADLLLIDDPIKNRAEADSATYRNRLWDEWQNTLLTRLHPGGRVVIILTRWHEDDLAGRLLKEEGRVEEGGKWHVLSLTAEAEEEEWDEENQKWKTYPDPLGRKPGEPLWPEHGFDHEWLESKKAEVGSFVWASLYQQRPRPRDAQRMFRREWFQIVDDYPHDAAGVRYWDMAASEPKKGKDPDWTAGCHMVEKKGQYWIVDMRRTRSSPLNTEQFVAQTAELDGRDLPIWQEEEGGSSGKNSTDHYRREVLKGYSFRADRVTGSKALRADPLSAAAEAGNVFLVRGSWNKEFLDEIDLFLTGAEDHDDQVDAASGAFSKLKKDPPKVGAIKVPHMSLWR